LKRGIPAHGNTVLLGALSGAFQLRKIFGWKCFAKKGSGKIPRGKSQAFALGRQQQRTGAGRNSRTGLTVKSHDLE
jgi:hypothetical protein